MTALDNGLAMALTVLIVDDHPSFRASARVLLEAEGFDVIGEAADGTSGIAEAKRLRPDLVLLDVQLPDIDGFEVAGAADQRATGPDIVLVSSRDSSDFGPLVARSGRPRLRPQGRALGRSHPRAPLRSTRVLAHERPAPRRAGR